MHGRMAQVWAVNKTNVVLSGTSLIRTLDALLANIQNTFGDPDQERTACTQLHALPMMAGMTAEEYMAKFGYQIDQNELPVTIRDSVGHQLAGGGHWKGFCVVAEVTALHIIWNVEAHGHQKLHAMSS